MTTFVPHVLKLNSNKNSGVSLGNVQILFTFDVFHELRLSVRTWPTCRKYVSKVKESLHETCSEEVVIVCNVVDLYAPLPTRAKSTSGRASRHFPSTLLILFTVSIGQTKSCLPVV